MSVTKNRKNYTAAETKVLVQCAEAVLYHNDGHEHYGSALSLFEACNTINNRIEAMPRKNSTVNKYTYKAEYIQPHHSRVEVWKYDVLGDRKYLLLTIQITE